MASVVRVLPALIAVSIGALAFKGVDIAQAFAEVTEEAAAVEAKGESELTSGVGDSGEASAENAEAPPAGEAEKCMPSTDYSTETGISEQEIFVLRSLSDRRKALDDREAGIETREQMAIAAEKRLEEQIAELKTIEADAQKVLAAMDAKRDERMMSLVKTYEAMKPKDAARIFNDMDDKVLIELVKSMKPATLAAIMSSMESKRAEALTKMLAALADLPPNLEALQKSAG